MDDESLAALDATVQQMSEAEYNAYIKGYNDVTERYKHFHLKVYHQKFVEVRYSVPLVTSSCSRVRYGISVQDSVQLNVEIIIYHFKRS